MAALGRGALDLALLLAAYAAIVGALAGVRRDRRLAASARNALYGLLGTVLVADAVLLAAILRHDFSFTVVASNTSRELPTRYLVASFWASQPGSLLLWLTILSAISCVVVTVNRRSHGELIPWLTAILGGVAAFFSLLLVLAASPFATQAPTPNGNGLNTALQNPYMVAHPPLLYLGYVGLTVPFAFCMAALIAGRSDARWIVSTRRWTLAAWTSLGVGMLLGAHWAYVEIGWGGFWAWDPVENAALMPWLVATAFLHSVMVQEKKGMLKVWNVCLVSATYALCILGTFLTRSGVLSSIHAFVESGVGWYFVAFIALVLGLSAGLVVWRLPLLGSEHRMESLVSREATFLFNNLLFVGLTFAILWGVLYPLASKAFAGEAITVTQPFFQFFAVVFGLPLILLMGIGPLIAWRRASLRSLRLAFGGPFVAGLAAAALLLLLGYGTNPAGVAAISLCVFVAITILGEFWRGASARRAMQRESWGTALVTLVRRNRRRYGGYIVHLAAVLAIIGIVGTTAYTTVHETTVRPGDRIAVRDYRLTFQGLRRTSGPNYDEVEARFAVTRGGDRLGTIAPATRVYTVEGQSNEVAIRTDYGRGEDLYAILSSVLPDGSVHVKVLINPLVNVLWLAGIVFLAGGLVAAWPDRREARRLARRYAEEPIPGEA
jgi:cytochrome c-type biogenesis protein CcmF